MAFFEVASGVGSLLGGVAGLFGARRKNPSPRDNMMSQAQGARDAAEAYGFNPLTMLQYGNPGGTGLANNGPPLASFDLIANGFKEIGDVVSGDADRRRAQEDAKLDLAKLEIERLQAGRSSDALGGVSPLGNAARTVGMSGGTFQSPRVVSNPDRTSVQLGGVNVAPYEGNSDAEEYEKRYSDIGGNILGLGNVVADGANTIYRGVKRVFDNHSSDYIRDQYWPDTYPRDLTGQPFGNKTIGEKIGEAASWLNGPPEPPMTDAEYQSYGNQKDIALWGAVPDGFTNGRPFWKEGRGITFTPPNARKGQY